MNATESSAIHAVIVETELQFSLEELSRACGAEAALLEALVLEGALAPQGDAPDQWRFDGAVLLRARKAIRLERELHLGAPGVALVLDLIEEIESLKVQLQHKLAASEESRHGS
jgi:chaperone modulatory protein CbpM